MTPIRTSTRFLAAFATAALLALPALAQAPTTPAAPSDAPKVIGQPQQPRLVPSMIVLNAKGAKLGGGKLVLEGVAPNAIVFADRPVRSAGHALTAHLLEEWTLNAPDSFARTPPNATVSVLSKAKGVVDAVVVLKSPKLEGDRLTFDVDVLEGDLAGGDGAVSVFTDLVNLPLARRTGHRGAWYHGAN
ncbi:MAG: hypothetical protein LCH95_08315 [Proteobacteria bacterium]|nr:hypothetical protein [Pseudomonadota bacterium]